MIETTFRRKWNNVPILSKDEIDEIAEQLLNDFSPSTLVEPQEIDIDRLVTQYLGLTLDFQYLSHCGVYLGMTVFKDSNSIPIYVPEENRADYIAAKAGTVIIDIPLLERSQQGRYRFTMAHEASHGFLHRPFFETNTNLDTGYDKLAIVQCRIEKSAEIGKHPRDWTDGEKMEWQANRMASALLMPKTMVQKIVATKPKGQMPQADLPSYYTGKMVQQFGVSYEAAFYRLKDLGLVPRNAYLSKDTAAFFRY